MNKLRTIIGFSLVISLAGCTANGNQPAAEQLSQKGEDLFTQETYLVTEVPAENGSYVISPDIPKDGKVPAGTEISIKATPSAG